MKFIDLFMINSQWHYNTEICYISYPENEPVCKTCEQILDDKNLRCRGILAFYGNNVSFDWRQLL